MSTIERVADRCAPGEGRGLRALHFTTWKTPCGIAGYAGSLVEVGSAREVFRNPVHPYTRGLLNSVPTLRSERSQPLRTIEGSVPGLSALPSGCLFEPRCEVRVPSCAEALPPLVEVSPGHLARCPVMQSELH